MSQQGQLDRFACRALGLALRGLSAALVPVGALAAAEYAHATVVDASPLATALLRASLTAILLGVFAFGRKGIAELAAELEEPPPDRPAPRSSRRRLYRPQRRLRRPRG